MDATLASLSATFIGTLAVDADTRRAATAFLLESERTPGFTLQLLRLADCGVAEHKVRQLAATHFKNIVRRHWNEEVPSEISAEDRATIKAHLVNLMATVPELVQRQLADALSIISKRDFPAEWPTLLPELVARLGTGDVSVTAGVMETAASIFSRFVEADNRDDVRLVLRYCLDNFAVPLLSTATAFTTRVDEATAAGASRAVLEPYLRILRHCTSIFYSLSWLEMPDVFQDHLPAWMAFFRKFLTYTNPLLSAASEDDEEGPLEAFQAAILDVIALCADKHDEDFEPFFATFAGDVWTLLSGTATSRIMASNMDSLVIQAVRFLTASVSKSMHVDFFKGPGVLEALCEKVAVPNMFLREADEIVFEENPVEFIRRDIEGSDNDTRRRVTSDFIRGLCKQFEAETTACLMTYINTLLAEYESNREANAMRKDAAIALFIALAVKGQTAASGVRLLNPLVDLSTFLTAHIIPELSAESVNARPVVKAAVIKFITTFRAQFTAEQLTALVPMLSVFVASTGFVVHTYAATALERLLSVKDRVESEGRWVWVPRLPVDVVNASLVPLLTAFFALMTKPGYRENEYLMRSLSRIVLFVKAGVVPVASQLIAGLSMILTSVCANPSNPTYNHCLFETLAIVMKSTLAAAPSTLPDFEASLFPQFQFVLQNNVAEFLPYIFQLMAQLLNAAPAAGVSGLTDSYKSLLGPLLTDSLWGSSGNVPALTTLMQAYARVGMADIVALGKFMALLGVWQKLLSTKNQEEYAFSLLDAIIEGAPFATLAPVLTPLLDFSLKKLQASKSAKLARAFCHSFSLMVGFHGAESVQPVLAAMSPSLFNQVIDHIIIPEAPRIASREQRKDAAVGLSRLLMETPAFLTDPARAASLNSLITAIVELLQLTPSAVAMHATSFDEDVSGDMADTVAEEYSAAYAKLAHASDSHRTALAGSVMAPDPKVYFAHALSKLSLARPGVLGPILAAAPVAATLRDVVTASGVVIA